MKISTKGQYALEIVTDLAMHSDAKQLESLRNVAVRRNLSEKYLERIVKSLKDAGIIKSVRGAYGGYCLEVLPEQLTVKQVLNAVEGQLAPVECLTKESDCGIDCDTCPTRGTWGLMWQTINRTVEKVTIQEIMEACREINTKE